MDNKLMYIPYEDTQNYPFCRLKLVAKMFEHLTQWNKYIKDPKVIRPKRYFETLGTNVITIPLSSLSV